MNVLHPICGKCNSLPSPYKLKIMDKSNAKDGKRMSTPFSNSEQSRQLGKGVLIVNSWLFKELEKYRV